VILVAKNNQSHDQLAKQFNERRVKKEYKALVWGELEVQGIIEGEIGRHPRNRQIFTVVPSGGRDSFTRFERLEYLAPLSLVNLHPKTGRTHQLRVHMKSINHPIFGDKAYGGGVQYAKSFHVKYAQLINRLIKIIPRVSLHARRLEISHPVTGKKMSFTSHIPTDFNNAMEILKHAKS
jgi:23S rRNA pseudouridine1911/1915/1917 synthase